MRKGSSTPGRNHHRSILSICLRTLLINLDNWIRANRVANSNSPPSSFFDVPFLTKEKLERMITFLVYRSKSSMSFFQVTELINFSDKLVSTRSLTSSSRGLFNFTFYFTFRPRFIGSSSLENKRKKHRYSIFSSQ